MRPKIPPILPRTITNGTIHKTKTFTSGDHILNCPKVTNNIGLMPIWAASETDILSASNLGNLSNLFLIGFSKSIIEAMATNERIKPMSASASGWIIK